jgi:hypothetical protein
MTIKSEATVDRLCAQHGALQVRYYLTARGVRAQWQAVNCRCRRLIWDDWIANK